MPLMLGSYFAAKVRGKRHEAGIRQVDLARMAGVSVDTIVAVEAGSLPRLQDRGGSGTNGLKSCSS